MTQISDFIPGLSIPISPKAEVPKARAENVVQHLISSATHPRDPVSESAWPHCISQYSDMCRQPFPLPAGETAQWIGYANYVIAAGPTTRFDLLRDLNTISTSQRVLVSRIGGLVIALLIKMSYTRRSPVNSTGVKCYEP